MQHQTFTDSDGMTWRVRLTTPTSVAAANTLPEAFRRGWLTFECDDGSIRRLAPVPDRWDALSPEELERLCRSARPGRPGETTPSNGVPSHPSRE